VEAGTPNTLEVSGVRVATVDVDCGHTASVFRTYLKADIVVWFIPPFAAVDPQAFT
jgi:hypothetical protein